MCGRGKMRELKVEAEKKAMEEAARQMRHMMLIINAIHSDMDRAKEREDYKKCAELKVKKQKLMDQLVILDQKRKSWTKPRESYEELQEKQQQK